MGGNIELKSELGKGSKFTFTISLREDTELNSETLPKYIAEQQLQGLHMLVVVELDSAKSAILEQLAELHLNIDTTSSGRDALTKIESSLKNGTPYDFVVADHGLPDMDVEVLAQDLTKKDVIKNSLMILLRSSPYEGDNDLLRKLGFSAYLIKPMLIGELANVLAIVWEAKRNNKYICQQSREN